MESLKRVAQPCLQRGVGKPSRGVELEMTDWVSGGVGQKGRRECEERLLKQGMAHAKAEAWEVKAEEPQSMNVPPSKVHVVTSNGRAREEAEQEEEDVV